MTISLRAGLLKAGLLLGLVVLSTLAISSVAQAAPPATTALTQFTPGDLVVYRDGDATTGTTNSGGTSQGAPVYLDEYDTSGNYVGSVKVTGAGTNPLVASGTATSEGGLSLSSNGQCLLATGYDAPLGTTGLPNTASATTPRTVAVVKGDASVNTSTALTDFSTANNPRSATSDDCNDIWAGGAAGGVEYTTVGSTTGTTVTKSTYKNVRQLQVVDGQLYTSADPTKAGLTIASVGTGLPKTAANLTPANLTTATSGYEPYGYAFLTLGSGSASTPDTLYVADNGNAQIDKYSLVGSTWTLEGSLTLPAANGDAANPNSPFYLAAEDVNGTAQIYVTTDDTSGTDGAIYSISDPTGSTGNFSGATVTQLSSALGTDSEAFRGIAFAPGTVIGSGGSGSQASSVPTVSPSSTGLPAAQDDTTNPTMQVVVGDTSSSVAASSETLTATSSNTSVAPQSGISLTQQPGTGNWTLRVTPGSTVGESSIALTATDPSSGRTTTQYVTYGLSAPEIGLTGLTGSPVYDDGAGNGSTEVPVGGGYYITGDDLTNVLHLYGPTSGPPVASYDFTGSQLPDGTSSIDIEAAAETTQNGVPVIFWFGSQSDSSGGATRPAADTVFETEVLGSGAGTQLMYLGSYTGLRGDLINWDVANGNPLGLNAASQADAKSTAGFNIEGAEFAPGSSSTVYLAFRAPLEPYASDSQTQDTGTASQTALIVPLTNLPGLMQTYLGPEENNSGQSIFGTAIKPNLGGLGLRELRKNADNQYLALAGTPGSSNSKAALYAWDGQPADPFVLTRTALPSNTGTDSWAWEGIVSEPDPLANGAKVTIEQDDGDQPWYGNGQTTKTKPALPTGLDKDLAATFTLSLASQTVSFSSTAGSPQAGTSYTVAAAASSGLPVTYAIDPASTASCSISGTTVSFTTAGNCVIDANQAGNYGYGPAQAKQTVAVSAVPGQTFVTPVVSSAPTFDTYSYTIGHGVVSARGTLGNNGQASTFRFVWQNGVSFGKSHSLYFIQKELAIYNDASGLSKVATSLLSLSSRHDQATFATTSSLLDPSKGQLNAFDVHINVAHLSESPAVQRSIRAGHIKHVYGYLEIPGTTFKLRINVPV